MQSRWGDIKLRDSPCGFMWRAFLLCRTSPAGRRDPSVCEETKQVWLRCTSLPENKYILLGREMVGERCVVDSARAKGMSDYEVAYHKERANMLQTRREQLIKEEKKRQALMSSQEKFVERRKFRAILRRYRAALWSNEPFQIKWWDDIEGPDGRTARQRQVQQGSPTTKK
eukprot:TRINITY_DN20065_c0_g1_i1.p2 TRINITY_DN20065_c0_g1~~TRINITY_DN20065_c0_g1_i1.p2  ORF type:complete len:171 (+),score=30.75 TRINITY_DN20065_c0_g1_i1:23-535(+)